VHALIVGVLLTGQLHLFTAETLHHHDEVTRVCKIAHTRGSYLHTTPVDGPVCPLCQVVRNGSIRPAMQGIIPASDQQSALLAVARDASYSINFASSLQARAPPLS
jgi:hypothetical protein